VRQAQQGAYAQERGQDQTHRDGCARHAIEQDHNSGAEPPDEYCEPERNVSVSHSCLAGEICSSLPSGGHANLLWQGVVLHGQEIQANKSDAALNSPASTLQETYETTSCLGLVHLLLNMK
jgi:hypothetical protein